MKFWLDTINLSQLELTPDASIILLILAGTVGSGVGTLPALRVIGGSYTWIGSGSSKELASHIRLCSTAIVAMSNPASLQGSILTFLIILG